MTDKIKLMIETVFCYPEGTDEYPKPVNSIKIDHYSWREDSVYRYFEKEAVCKKLKQTVDIAVENEFLRWDDEATIRFLIEGFGYMRCDHDIPSHDAWTDDRAFERKATETLKSLVKNNRELEITDTVRRAEYLLQEEKRQGDNKLVQIYERILYELNECSLREFAELKRAVCEEDK